MAARFLTALAAALLLASPSVWAQSQPADPPSRVGRVSAIEGAVQQRTPDDNDWVPANLNYPVSTGFAIAPQDGGRAEIEVGSTALRVGSLSELDVTDLGDRDASLTLAQGELNVRVGRLENGERLEIVTPRGVIDVLAAGEYHIDAGTTESPTRFEVFNGRAELQRDGGNTALADGQAALINADDSQSLTMASPEPDPLDQWAFARDGGGAAPVNTARAAPPAPAPYVSPEMTGEADLSAYGNWAPNPDYGQVWYPSGVPADWAPYTYGHWAWVSPWGWTWIDDEPWGFAPFHYGRWAYADSGWCWVPGEVVDEPVFAPALVVFVGSPEHRFFFDRDREGVGWFPLGPREAYVPGYRTSIDYVRNVNRTNVDVRNLNITRVNNTFVVNNGRGDAAGNFANHRFATVVPANQFGHGNQRVRDIAVRNASVATAAASLPVSHDPAVTPPRTAAGSGAPVNRTAQFNRGTRPPLPQARTAAGVQPRQPSGSAPAASATTRSVAGHTLPALPPAHGGAAPNAPTRFGAGAPTAATNAGRGLPPVPPAQGTARSFDRGGSGAPHGAAVNNAEPNGRTARGPFGTARPTATTNSTAPNVTSSSAGRGLSQLPTTRQQMQRPPVPQPHVAQPPTLQTGSSASHRGFAAPATPSPQHNVAVAPSRNFAPPPRPQPPVQTTAPTRNFAPPPRPQAPTQTAAPARNFAPPPRPQAPAQTAAPARNFAPPPRPQPPAPQIAAPVHSAPPAAPARPANNAAASHAPAPAPHPQPAPQHAAPNNNNKKQNQ